MKTTKFFAINIDAKDEKETETTIQNLIDCLGNGYKIINTISNGTGSVYYILERDEYEI